MDDQYCDQGYCRRKNRFSAFDSNIENYNRRVPMKRGNSVHAANLSMDADYFNSHHGQYDCAPDFRESYATQYNFDNSRLSNPHECQVVARNRILFIDNGIVACNSCAIQPCHQDAYDINDYSANNQHFSLCSAHTGGDIIGRETYCTYETPVRTSSQLCNHSRELRGNNEAVYHCDGCCNHSPSRPTNQTCCHSQPENTNPSREFKEEVIKVIEPLIEKLRSSGKMQQRESNVFEVSAEVVSNKPKGALLEEIKITETKKPDVKKADDKVEKLAESLRK